MSTGRRSGLAVLAAVVVLATACAGDEANTDDLVAAAVRTIEIRASEYAFNGDPGVIRAGDMVEFAVDNVGQIEHNLEVLSAAGRSLGRTERIPAGSTASVTVTFDEPGTYRLICDVDDHLSRGQSATITVS